MNEIKKVCYSQKEEGQSLIELALSLVVLLILLAGVVDFGRIAFYYIAMRDSAQEGASYGSIFPNDCEEIINRVEAGVVDTNRINVTLNIDGDECKVCDHKYSPGEIIEIKVSDPNFPLTMPFIGIFIGKNEISLETTIKDNIVRVPVCP